LFHLFEEVVNSIVLIKLTLVDISVATLASPRMRRETNMTAAEVARLNLNRAELQEQLCVLSTSPSVEEIHALIGLSKTRLSRQQAFPNIILARDSAHTPPFLAKNL